MSIGQVLKGSSRKYPGGQDRLEITRVGKVLVCVSVPQTPLFTTFFHYGYVFTQCQVVFTPSEVEGQKKPPAIRCSSMMTRKVGGAGSAVRTRGLWLWGGRRGGDHLCGLGRELGVAGPDDSLHGVTIPEDDGLLEVVVGAERIRAGRLEQGTGCLHGGLEGLLAPRGVKVQQGLGRGDLSVVHGGRSGLRGREAGRDLLRHGHWGHNRRGRVEVHRGQRREGRLRGPNWHVLQTGGLHDQR